MSFRILAVVVIGAFTWISAPSAKVVLLPKCFGVIVGPLDNRRVICQNPCIGGVGCAHHFGTIPGGWQQGESCKCQGGSVECCDIWLISTGEEVAAGRCGGNDPQGGGVNCPSDGDCEAQEDEGGDVSSYCTGA